MKIIRSSLRAKYRLLTPDHEEEQSSLHLLIWRDIPYWTVVDSELRRMLGELDGRRALREVMDRMPVGERLARRAFRAGLETLLARGAVREADAPAPNSPRRARGIESLSIHVTNRCNLRCAFCYNRGREALPAEPELSAEEMVSLLDAAKPLCSRSASVFLLGGEPLLAPEKVLAVARHARRNRLGCVVSTNGLLLDAAFASAARKAALQVQVSVDGAAAATHDAVRGVGSFAQAIRGVETLVRGGAYTLLSMVCHQDNVAELESFYALGRRLGVNEVRFIPLKRLGGAATSGHAPVPQDALMRTAKELFRRHPEYSRLRGRDAYSILVRVCGHAAPRQSCGTGCETVLLDANGDLYPCLNTRVPELRVASIREPGFSFADAWKNAAALQRIRQATDVDNPGCGCYTCAVKHWCLGGCRGETLQTRGRLELPAGNCSEQRRAILDVFWTLAEQPEQVRNKAVANC